jgi:hypothetical protein
LPFYFWGIYGVDFPERPNMKAPRGSNISLEPFFFSPILNLKKPLPAKEKIALDFRQLQNSNSIGMSKDCADI